MAESRRPSLVRKAVRALGPSKSRKSSSIPLPPCQTSPTCAPRRTNDIVNTTTTMTIFFFFFCYFLLFCLSKWSSSGSKCPTPKKIRWRKKVPRFSWFIDLSSLFTWWVKMGRLQTKQTTCEDMIGRRETAWKAIKHSTAQTHTRNCVCVCVWIDWQLFSSTHEHNWSIFSEKCLTCGGIRMKQFFFLLSEGRKEIAPNWIIAWKTLVL